PSGARIVPSQDRAAGSPWRYPPLEEDATTACKTWISGRLHYVAKAGGLTFQAGQTTRTITVLVYGDTKYEQNETFQVILSSPTNAAIQDNVGVGAIVNDDGWPTITISDVSHVEGNSGTSMFTFIVALSNPSFQT